MTGGINLAADWSCMDGPIIGAVLGQADGILNGWGPTTAGGQVVLCFDEPLRNETGPDLIIHAIGSGWCVTPQYPGEIKPVKVYISAYSSSYIYPLSERDEIFPVPWYFEENYTHSPGQRDGYWFYVGTVTPSAPPCVGGGVVYETEIDFDNIRSNDNVTYDPNPAPYGHFEDTGTLLNFNDFFGTKGIRYVKIVFGDLTKWEDYPYSTSDEGISCYETGDPDGWPTLLTIGSGHAKYIDAVEGLHH